MHTDDFIRLKSFVEASIAGQTVQVLMGNDWIDLPQLPEWEKYTKAQLRVKPAAREWFINDYPAGTTSTAHDTLEEAKAFKGPTGQRIVRVREVDISE